ncbi:hypothetical protein C8R45DRAFT_1146341 [Mycena sanguinolenta]|nr:hypothetical protein C8R45DRAFT_1146341 [Mycena sanguinolenta]
MTRAEARGGALTSFGLLWVTCKGATMDFRNAISWTNSPSIMKPGELGDRRLTELYRWGFVQGIQADTECNLLKENSRSSAVLPIIEPRGLSENTGKEIQEGTGLAALKNSNGPPFLSGPGYTVIVTAKSSLKSSTCSHNPTCKVPASLMHTDNVMGPLTAPYSLMTPSWVGTLGEGGWRVRFVRIEIDSFQMVSASQLLNDSSLADSLPRHNGDYKHLFVKNHGILRLKPGISMSKMLPRAKIAFDISLYALQCVNNRSSSNSNQFTDSQRLGILAGVQFGIQNRHGRRANEERECASRVLLYFPPSGLARRAQYSAITSSEILDTYLHERLLLGLNCTGAALVAE